MLRLMLLFIAFKVNSFFDMKQDAQWMKIETSHWKTSIRFFDANCWAKPRRFLEWKSLKKSHFYYTASEAM